MKKTNSEMTKRPSFRKTVFPAGFRRIKKIRSAGGLFLGIILLNGCASFGQSKPYQINRMPPPEGGY